MKATLPQGFTVQAPTMDDLGAAVEVIRAYETALYGKAEQTEEHLLTEWQDPEFNLATDAWIIRSPQGQVVGFANMMHVDHIKFYTRSIVHPDYQESGIEGYLLDLIEERARQHIPLAAPGLRMTIMGGAGANDLARQRLKEQYGWCHVRTFWRMGIELNEAPPEPQWAEGIIVSTLQPGMERAAYEADEEAFEDHWGHVPISYERWEQFTLKSEGHDPTLWFLAMDGDQVAGFAFCKDEKENGGWVHVLGVRQQWRRKGIGMALLYQAFGEFYRRGIYKVYLGVDSDSLTGATRLYERAGMRVVQQFYRYEKELRAGKEVAVGG